MTTGRPLLEGLRVIEVGSTLCSARISQFLADYGATVEMIEQPAGSSLRRSGAWPSLGRGKYSRALDLSEPAGQSVFVDLLGDSDVLIRGTSAKTADELGLSYDRLAELNPRLVVASVSGFGDLGPLSHLPGYEGIVMAKLGLYEGFSRITRRAGPSFCSVPYASYCAAQVAIHGILAALIERRRAGSGQHVQTNLAQALATMDCWNWFLIMIAERFPEAYRQVPAYDAKGTPNAHQALTLLIAATADDRWLQFSQLQPHLFAAFLKALDMVDLTEEPGWSGLPIYDDSEKRAAVWERMLLAAQKLSLSEWDEVFDEDTNVFAELFRQESEVLDHPVLAAKGFSAETIDPVVGRIRQMGRLVRVEGQEWLPSPSPRLDEHPSGPAADPLPAWGDGAPAGSTDGRPPLEGLTILDLCVWYATPYGSSLLADLGARVIHVEPPSGDPIRVAVNFPEIGSMKATQGKESIVIDMATPEGRQIVHKLAAQSSIVLQGFRARVATKLGVDAESLRQVNPNLVYVDATGYGVDGPYSAKPSYAPSIAAAAGITMRNIGQHLGLEPARTLDEIKDRVRRLGAATSSPSTNADGLAALGAASALMLGLAAASRGDVPHLETTMLSSAASVILDSLVEYEGATWPKPDPELFGFGALYRLYESGDGWVFLAAPRESDWPALVAAFEGRTALGDDPRFSTAKQRAEHDGDLAEVLASAFRQESGAYWEADLSAREVACVVSSTEATEGLLMSDEVGRTSGYVADVTHPTYDDHPRMAPVIRFSRSATIARPGCLAGQHTDAILSELGMDDAAIADLRARSIVR
jgi:crotonobetainyl-CoA:carnitine CoA-transferase CaiB-like acyl-CoA transferase